MIKHWRVWIFFFLFLFLLNSIWRLEDYFFGLSSFLLIKNFSECITFSTAYISKQYPRSKFASGDRRNSFSCAIEMDWCERCLRMRGWFMCLSIREWTGFMMASHGLWPQLASPVFVFLVYVSLRIPVCELSWDIKKKNVVSAFVLYRYFRMSF